MGPETMNLVVAVDRGWGIGNKGELLVRIREDLKNFAALTTGKVVVLGSKTLSTFPGGRILKNRTNIVLSHNPEYAPEGAVMARSTEELIEILRQYESEDVYVIGGASVYRQLLPYCTRAYVTKICGDFIKDAFFCDLDCDGAWACVSESESYESTPEDFLGPLCDGSVPDKVSYTFCIYQRKEGL